jgi:hypothetical protein
MHWFTHFLKQAARHQAVDTEPLSLLQIKVVNASRFKRPLQTATTSFEVVFHNQGELAEGLTSIVRVDDIPDLGKSDDLTDTILDTPLNSPVQHDLSYRGEWGAQPTWKNSGVYRFGIYVTPMTPLGQFVERFPRRFQPLTMTWKASWDNHTLMGDALGIPLTKRAAGQNPILDCLYGVSEHPGHSGFLLTLERATTFTATPARWNSSLVLDEPCKKYLHPTPNEDGAASKEIPTYLSNPSIDRFVGAYGVICQYPGVRSRGRYSTASPINASRHGPGSSRTHTTPTRGTDIAVTILVPV